MPIKINNWGGRIVWYFRKHHSDLTSKISLSFVGKVRAKKINAYIDYFLEESKKGIVPDFKFIMLETINRCNGKCAFCPANVNDESRPYMKMEDGTIHKVLSDLEKMQWSGHIFLQVNNEPFIDKRLFDIAKSCKKRIKQCHVCIITNGSILTIEKLEQLVPYIDKLVINDYSEKYELSDNIKNIVRYVQENANKFCDVEIEVNRRYSGEILATRAGSAPNKPHKNNKINAPCIYPFTDLIIFPDGKVGMCCNDCKEITDMGNVNKENLQDIWQGNKFMEMRKAMRKGRNNYPFCMECDVVDAGSREKVING